MPPYYVEKLSALRLKRVYEIATPQICQYLDAELDHVLNKIKAGDTVLDLGCGYGRIIPQLAEKAGTVVGIDSSMESLRLGSEMLADFMMRQDGIVIDILTFYYRWSAGYCGFIHLNTKVIRAGDLALICNISGIDIPKIPALFGWRQKLHLTLPCLNVKSYFRHHLLIFPKTPRLIRPGIRRRDYL